MIILPVLQGNPIFFNSVNFHKRNNRNSVSSQKILQALGQNRKRNEQILNKRHFSLLAAQELCQQKYVWESLGLKQPSASTGQIIHRKRQKKKERKKKVKRDHKHASQDHQALLKIVWPHSSHCARPEHCALLYHLEHLEPGFQCTHSAYCQVLKREATKCLLI